jgi:hypothetical protein
MLFKIIMKTHLLTFQCIFREVLVNMIYHNKAYIHKVTTTEGYVYIYIYDRPCGLVVRVLGYRSGGSGSIPGTTRKKNSGSGTGSTQPREYN